MEDQDPRLGRLRIVAGVLILLGVASMVLGAVLSAQDPTREIQAFGVLFLGLGGVGVVLWVTAWVLGR